MHESNIPDNSLPKRKFTGSIEVSNQQTEPVPQNDIRRVVAEILVDANYHAGEISLAVVNDDKMHELNRQYLAHDYPTDVLSFVFNADTSQRSLEGEIIVSFDTAASVANELNHSVLDELLLYVIHGTLHLVGYDDKSPDDRETMRLAEQRYLDFLGIDLVFERDEVTPTQPSPCEHDFSRESES